MAKLLEKREKGFNIVYCDLFEPPICVYLGDCLIKSSLTYKEAENFIEDKLKSLKKNNF